MWIPSIASWTILLQLKIKKIQHHTYLPFNQVCHYHQTSKPYHHHHIIIIIIVIIIVIIVSSSLLSIGYVKDVTCRYASKWSNYIPLRVPTAASMDDARYDTSSSSSSWCCYPFVCVQQRKKPWKVAVGVLY